MNIVFITTEAVPFAKTGGLADVCGALPRRLAELGHNVSVVMPAFRQIYAADRPIEPLDLTVRVDIAGRVIGGRVLAGTLPGDKVPVYFVDQPQYYDREALYGDGSGDYRDNCERFVFFCRAALEMITRLDLQPDIVHCNDWQSGLIPAYIKLRFDPHDWMNSATTVMTIHNLAYQGSFWHWDQLLTGIGWQHFNHHEMEAYGKLNLLKTGLVFADWITTVSPRYAQEIQSPELGCGLDGVLRDRRDRLTGIINGIDPEEWDPSKDPALPLNYDVSSWRQGKRAAKTEVQQILGLPPAEGVPLIGLIGRLAEQKGWDLLIDMMDNWLADGRRVQWAVLGSGESRYQLQLERLAAAYSDRVGLLVGFSNELAHKIEAAADIFLMPSRYEPCGLNQLYSLCYGAVPIVNPTGGLADTVVDYNEITAADGSATGFHLPTYDAAGLSSTGDRALDLWAGHPDRWGQIVETGMRQDWSWTRSAQAYEALYQRVIRGR